MKPGRVATVCALAFGTLGFVLVAVGGLATVVGAAGLCSLAVGCLTGSRSAVTLGAVGLFAAMVVAGVGGVGAPTLVGSSAAALIAWTVGQTATELRTAFDARARTQALELTHVAGTALVATAVGGVALAPQALTVDPTPLGTTLLLGGAVLLTTSLLGSTRSGGE
ncbi:DUF7519 family protein [Halorientalis salina]|uniref:DUF7519 family protein n=1 Tax=Halorientalis salina TaxID=2932266 RepID=UPI0010AD8F1B|nr:hypothetical protein [Halorientalis salina]